MKSKQANRLAGLNQRSSRLVENLSEFLASRNVINRSSRYDKIVSCGEDEEDEEEENKTRAARSSLDLNLNSAQFYDEQVMFPETLSASTSISGRLFESSRSNQAPAFQTSDCCLNQTNQPPHTQPRPITYKNYHANRFGKGNKKQGRVKVLLGALFSRKQNNKATLVLSLLRAPVVLAALFSLLLVATLMVFYTMSFHHHNCHSHAIQHQQQQQHHINSRQLKPFTNETTNSAKPSNYKENSSKKVITRQWETLDQSSAGDSIDDDKLTSQLLAQQQQQQQTESKQKQTIQAEAKDGNYERALTVQTECGAFVGSPEGKSIVFKGIAYASPPVGARRWTRPRPVWQDQKLCKPNETKPKLDFQTHCAQLSPVTRRFSGHEDCLYLDIYTPKLNDQVKVSDCQLFQN